MVGKVPQIQHQVPSIHQLRGTSMTPSCLSAATVLSNFSVTDKLRCAFLVQFSLVFTFNKQLLDEVEHDIMNYIKTEVCRRLRQIIQTRGFDNS